MRWLFAGLLAIAVAFAVCSIAMHREQITVPLAGGGALQIAHVSLGTNHVFSTEPIWTQTLRRILPASLGRKLGAARGETIATPYSTLVIWMRAPGAPMAGMPRVAVPVAVLDGTNVFPGRVSQMNSNTFRLQFTAFARHRDQIPLRLRYGPDVVEFTVRNPQPVSQIARPALPLPQTNDLGHTKIILRRLQSFKHRGNTEIIPSFTASANPAAGWTQWRFLAFGDNGNWTDSRYAEARSMAALSSSGRLRLSAVGTEYISAAFVERPPAGTVRALAPPDRARPFGLRHVTLMGPGIYQFTNGAVVMAGAPEGISSHFSFASVTATNWAAAIRTSLPSLFYWSDVDSSLPAPKLRLRERLPDGRGRIFTAGATLSSTNVLGKMKRVAVLFTPSLPPFTTNLEVEVIVALPPADFHIAIP